MSVPQDNPSLIEFKSQIKYLKNKTSAFLFSLGFDFDDNEREEKRFEESYYDRSLFHEFDKYITDVVSKTSLYIEDMEDDEIRDTVKNVGDGVDLDKIDEFDDDDDENMFGDQDSDDDDEV